MPKRLIKKFYMVPGKIYRRAITQLHILSIASIACCVAMLLIPTKTPHSHHVLENIVRTAVDLSIQMRDKVQTRIVQGLAAENKRLDVAGGGALIANGIL